MNRGIQWGWWLASAMLAAYASALVAMFIGVFLLGIPYYPLDLDARAEHALHPYLAPGQAGGIALGLLGTVLMSGMLVYTLRKWLVRWTWLGDISHWLRFHIICGVMGPAFILLHTSFRLPHGMISIGFWCMVLVAVSGVFGRYVYGYFPRMAGGRELAYGEAMTELANLHEELVAETVNESGDAVGRAFATVRDFEFEARSLFDLVRVNAELARRRQQVNKLLGQTQLAPEVRQQAKRTLYDQLQLKSGVETARVAGRLMRYWHLFHRPLAGAMYVIVGLHILEAILFAGACARLFTLFE